MVMLLALIAGIVLVVALVLFFVTPVKAAKVPAVVLAAFGGLGLGFVAGMAALQAYGDQWDPFDSRAEAAATKGAGAATKGGGPGGGATTKGGGGAMTKGGGGAMTKGGGGAMTKGGGGAMTKGGGRRPDPKTQLLALVTKLDVLTTTPLSITLSDDQKAKLRAQLDTLAGIHDLTAKDAQEQLDALHAIIADHQKTLDDAGYRWGDRTPGAFSFPMTPPNPFSYPGSPDARHLKSLRKRVGSEFPEESKETKSKPDDAKDTK